MGWLIQLREDLYNFYGVKQTIYNWEQGSWLCGVGFSGCESFPFLSIGSLTIVRIQDWKFQPKNTCLIRGLLNYTYRKSTVVKDQPIPRRRRFFLENLLGAPGDTPAIQPFLAQVCQGPALIAGGSNRGLKGYPTVIQNDHGLSCKMHQSIQKKSGFERWAWLVPISGFKKQTHWVPESCCWTVCGWYSL